MMIGISLSPCALRAAGPSVPAQNVALNNLSGLGFSIPDTWFADGVANRAAKFAQVFAAGERLGRADVRHSTYVADGNMSLVDGIMTDADAAGVEMMGCIGAISTGGALNDSTKRTAYAAFCGMVAARYPQIMFWEICNEPNMTGTVAVAMADYALALELACTAIWAANPTAIVIGGALAGIQNTSGGFQSTTAFVSYIYANCPIFLANPQRTGISLHSYTDSATYNWLHGDNTQDWHTKKIIANVKAIMVAAGDLDRQIYITETGIHTYGAGFTEDWQYRWAREQTPDLLADPRIGAVLWHTASDRPAQGATAQDYYGVWGPTNVPKKALYEFTRYAQLYASGAPAFEVDKGADRTIPIFRFFKDLTSPARRNLTYALTGAPAGVAINSTTGIVTVTDASAVAQLMTPIICRAAHTNGTYADLQFYLTVQNANLISNGDFFASGNVTGWSAAGSADAPTFDVGQGALLSNVTGAGGGYALASNLTLETGEIYEREIVLRKGTYSGSLVNIFMDGNAMSPAFIPVGADYARLRGRYTQADTAGIVADTRNGTPTGTLYCLRQVVRKIAKPTSAAAAYAAYAAACVVPPTPTRALAFKAMFDALWSAGLYDRISNLTAFCADTAQAARINLKDPSRVAIEVNAMTHTPGFGYSGDGVSGHIDFGESFAHSGHLTLNSATLWAFCNQQNGSAGVKTHLGSTNGTPITFVGATSTGSPVQRVNGSTGASGGTSDGSRARRRFVARENSTNIQYDRNGVAQFDSAAASSAIVTGNVTSHRAGTSYTSDRLSLVGWGAGFTAAERVTLDGIFLTFVTAFGAQ